jgi:antitoxin ParD1/3/4
MALLMSKDTSVSVDRHFADFIERQVQAGRYDSSSDVVRAGLRLLEEQELKIERLRAALLEGERSGEATPFDLDDFLDEMHRDRAGPR